MMMKAMMAIRITAPIPISMGRLTQPRLAAGGGGGGAALTNGAPHLAQVWAMAGFSAPQDGHLIGAAGSVFSPPSTPPASRALPSARGAVHCLQAVAVLGLRVPQ